MTRINSNIDPRRLTDEHLMAEHREIKRLPHCLKTRLSAKRRNTIPVRFTLGTWHYNKEKITKEQAINILYNGR